MKRPQGDEPRGLLASVWRWLDVRPEEVRLVSLLALGAFATLAAYYFLKPASKSLFLASHDAESLRFAFLWVAGATLAVGSLHAALARRLPPRVLAIAILGGLSAITALFRVAVSAHVETPFVAQAFYVHVSAYGVLATAMFWLATNHLLEPRQARRLLGLVGAGAVAGGIAGGYLAGGLVHFVGTANLLWGGVVLGLAALVALDLAFRCRPGAWAPQRQRPGDRRSAAMLILRTPFLRLIGGLIAITMVCASLAEYQFSVVVQEFLPEGDATAAYLGFWYSTIALMALPAQLLVAGPVLRRFGVGPALLVLPLGMLGLGVALAVHPALALGTALKAGDGALRYSVNKSALELLYLPVPHWVNDRAKVFLDTVVDRLAKGGAGLLLILLVDGAGFGLRAVSVLTAALAAGWVAFALLVRRRYVDAFRAALDRGGVDLASARIRLDEPAAWTAVAGALASSDPRTVQQALDILDAAEDVAIAPVEARLAELAASADVELATRALRLCARAPSAAAVESARVRMLGDDAEAGAAAARVLLADWVGTDEEFLRGSATPGPESEARAAGAVLGAGRGVPPEVLQRVMEGSSRDAILARATFARALCRGNLAEHRPLLRRLVADPEQEVALAALRGAGSLHDESLVPVLAVALSRPASRGAAREALAAMGPSVLARLESWLHDPGVTAAVRRRLPRAMGAIGTAEAQAALVRGLRLPDPVLRHRVIKALNRMAAEQPALKVPAATLEACILAECRELAGVLAVLASHGAEGRMSRLLRRAAADAARYGRERLFRLLGLTGRGTDWANAFAGLLGDDPRLRASAVEFADGMLDQCLRRVVVPLIEDIPPGEAARQAGRYLGVPVTGRSKALAFAAASGDSWLAASAFHAAVEEGESSVVALARQRRLDSDPWVLEAAACVLARWPDVPDTAGAPLPC